MRLENFKIAIAVLCLSAFSVKSFAQITLNDNFDSYEVGNYIGVVSPDYWTTWSNAPGTSEDLVITDAQAASGDHSLLVSAGVDGVLSLGDQTNGRYEVSFDYFIPATKTGYFNILHLFDGNDSKWGFQVTFPEGATAQVDAGGSGAASFDFVYDEWMSFRHVINMDNDWAEFWYNDELIYEWQWSLGASNDSGLNQLGGINFYAWDNGGNGTPEYYVDNINVEEVEAPEAPINLTATVSGTMIDLAWDAPTAVVPSGYNVYRNGVLILENHPTTTYTDVHSVPGTYTYFVKAVYEVAISDASNSVEGFIEGGTDREMVILEIATGTWCGFCPGAAMGADELVELGHNVAVIEYHSGDEYETLQAGARIGYYGIGGFPTSVFDGVEGISGGNPDESIYESMAPIADASAEIPGLFGINLDVLPVGGNTFKISATVSKEFQCGENISLHFVLTESHIPEVWLGGLEEVNFVCREMYPNEYGTELDFSTQDEVTVEFEVEINTVIENSEIVAFVQDNDTKLIHQGAKLAVPVISSAQANTQIRSKIYPNPNTDGVVYVEANAVVKMVSVYTQSGQLIKQVATDTMTPDVDVTGLEAGMYFMRIETEFGSTIQKLSIR